MASPDPSPSTSTQQKESESLVNLLAEASRFYRKAYNELFSDVTTEQEPESSTNTPEHMLFGWHLFLMLRSRSPELFKDLVSCIHGLVAVLAILFIHVPAKFRRFTSLIKQTEKGVDLIASLCHNYHTSEERLKEMMEKSHMAIEDVFSTKALSASECKTENLDNIDTDGLMYFEGLIDMECFQSNLEKLEKHCNSNSSEGELDFKLILINNDYVPTAENSSGDSTNLGQSKRIFEILASPTKTIKDMLTLTSSPLSPAKGGSGKIVQMTPITSAMTTAKWLREVIASLPEKPSSKLQQLLSSCDRDLTNAVTERVSIVLEAIFPTNRGGSLGLSCANAFDIPWAEARKMEASKLYYRVLEAICRAELQNNNVNNLTPLLSNERFHRCLIACSAELVLATHKSVIKMFPVLESAGLTAFDLSKIIESVVRHEETLPRVLKRHLNSLEEQLLESMVWEKGSSLYNSLIVARPSVAEEINRLSLMAEPMPSLDGLVARQNIHVEGLLATPSQKRAAGPDDNADPRSPKRLCNESRNTVVEHNLQTPPPKQSHLVSTSLKERCHPLQSTFESPTVTNPVGGNEKCADVTIQIFFSKILKLAAIRIRNLCERVQYVEQTECVYNVFKQILDQQTTLFFNRHIDQIILCCLYGVAKACRFELSFKEILNHYKKEAQCKPEVFSHIYIGSRCNGVLVSRHVGIIPFYNEVFVPAAKPFLVSLISSGTCPEDNKNANGQIPGSPKPSPFPKLPDMSPKKVSASCNVYVSPLRQAKMDLLLSPSSRSFYACIGEGIYAYQSPSKDLDAINNRLKHNGRRVNSRLNFDMVSDSVVAGSLGQPNGVSLDPAAAFSPISKKRKPDT